MHFVILGAIRAFFGWLFGQAVLKAIILTILASALVFVGEWLWSLLPSFMSVSVLNSAWLSLPAGVWWFLDLFRLSYGAPIIFSSACVAFLIRRLPVVG